MNYTEDNVIGLEVAHKDGTCKYRIVNVRNGKIDTESIHHNNSFSAGWATIKDVNNWLSSGIWKILKTTEYEIY